jgi:transcriptional regulator with XRE-family HTH domain
MNRDNETMGKRLKRFREEKNLTATVVARLIDVPESTYREWEYGRGLKLPPCQKISQVLDISITELVTGELPDLQVHLEDLRKLEESLRETRLKLSSRI